MPPLTPTPSLANYYLHYTSREGAHGIIAAGLIATGRSGKIYLTDRVYTFGADAADALSLMNKAVELACLIQGDGVGRLEGPFTVEPIRDGAGNLIRSGGGVEYYSFTPIPVGREKERWLGLLQP